MSNQTKATTDIAQLDDKYESRIPKDITDEEIRKTVEARSLLSDPEQKEAQDEADGMYELILGDTNMQMSLGTSAVANLNAKFQEYSERKRRIVVDPMKESLQATAQKSAHMDANYNPSDPHVLTKMRRRVEGKGVHFWSRTRDIFEDYVLDKKDSYEILDLLRARTQDALAQVRRQIANDDVYFQAYQNEYDDLVQVVAVMEFLRDRAQTELETLNADQGEMSDLDYGKRRDLLSTFIHRFNSKINEYRNRMWAGRAQMQKIINRREGHVSLAMNLDNHLNLTIPQIRGSVEDMGDVLEMMRVSGLSEDLADQYNLSMIKSTELETEITPRIHEIGSRSTMRGETIRTMGELVAGMNNRVAENIARVQETEVRNMKEILVANRLMDESREGIIDAATERQVEQAISRLLKAEEEDAQAIESEKTRNQRLS